MLKTVKIYKRGINSIAIMSNDTKNKKIRVAKNNNFDNLHYLIDESQEIAKKYGAVCTPDFLAITEFRHGEDLEIKRSKNLEKVAKISNEINRRK